MLAKSTFSASAWVTARVSRVFGSCSAVCAPSASVVVVGDTVVVPTPITWMLGSSSR